MTKSFVRESEVDIRKYLPSFLFKDHTLAAVADSQSEEHERWRLYISDLLLQANVGTATWGLKFWEKDLDLTVHEDDSFEIRRNRIWDKLQSHNISTLDFITRVINRYAEDKARVEEIPEEYKIKITMEADGCVSDWNGLLDALTTWLPAHIAYDVLIEWVLYGGFYFGGMISQFEIVTIPYEEGGQV